MLHLVGNRDNPPHARHALDNLRAHSRESFASSASPTKSSAQVPSPLSSRARSRESLSTNATSVVNHMQMRRKHVRQFQHIKHEDALHAAREGEVLHKITTEQKNTKWAQWRPVLKSLFYYSMHSTSEYYFVVTNSGEPWRAALRWGATYEQAIGEEPAGSIGFEDVQLVTATVLRDDDCTQHAGEERATYTTECEFQIVCADRTIQLRARNRESMKTWATALVLLANSAQGFHPSLRRQRTDISLQSYVRRLLSRQESFPIEKIVELTSEQLNISLKTEHVQEIMAGIDNDIPSSFDADALSVFFHRFIIKDTLNSWFSKYATPRNIHDSTDTQQVITPGMFQTFLETEQREHIFFCGYTNAVELFEVLHEPYTCEVASGELALTEAGFSYLMCCAENSLFDPCRRAHVSQEMNRPLSHYWIASSHNTYLEGHQLVGQSSLHRYIEVLMKGCRCVEIDCWDGDAGEPIVTHGWTMTSKILFYDVIRVCRDYGFVVSSYPLILSLEVHCGSEQRDRMAQILKDILGEKLLTPTDYTTPTLVSPESARFKVIVKAKIPEQSTPSFGQSRSTSAPTRISAASDNSSVSFDNRIIYMPTVKLHNMVERQPDDKTLVCSCNSFNDQSAITAMQQYGLKRLRAHHRNRVSRVYPHATRVGSDNYDPLAMWLAGFQIVALNYQSVDLPMILNMGLFTQENGGCGYVLKPALILGAVGQEEAEEEESALECTEQHADDLTATPVVCILKLTVLSGHWLPKPQQMGSPQDSSTISPTVRLSLCGSPQDKQVAHTVSLPQNGLDPAWNERFVFEIAHPSLAILVFEIFDTSNSCEQELIAAAAVPLSGIREGIRWVPLLDWRYHTIDLCGLLVEARPQGPWAEMQLQQRLKQAPLDEASCRLISHGPGGLEARRTVRGRSTSEPSRNQSIARHSDVEATSRQKSKSNREGIPTEVPNAIMAESEVSMPALQNTRVSL